MSSELAAQMRLLLSARQAAKALAICEKTLWSHTQPRGSIPSIKIGSRVLYAVDDLRRWIDEQKGGPRHDAK